MVDIASFVVDEVSGVGWDGGEQGVGRNCSFIAIDEPHGPIGPVSIAGRTRIGFQLSFFCSDEGYVG